MFLSLWGETLPLLGKDLKAFPFILGEVLQKGKPHSKVAGKIHSLPFLFPDPKQKAIPPSRGGDLTLSVHKTTLFPNPPPQK